MNKILIILSMFGLSINLFSQELNDEIISGFYKQTFQDYFSQRILSGKITVFYIKNDSLQLKTRIEFENFKIHIVNEIQAQELIKKHKITELYWTKINKISKDTIDVLIGGWTVNYKKGNYKYSAWCGGTNGYVPQGRFIYNYNTKKWNYISEKEIIDDKITEYKRMLKE